MAQTTIGRNDPCHCGSGKKYKKCCLAKDERARQAQSAGQATAADFNSAEVDPKRINKTEPKIEAFEARLKDFEAADYEGKFTLLNKTLDEPGLMDRDMAFEMLTALFRCAIEHGERIRFDALVDKFRERLPEVYAAEPSFILSWRIANALVEMRSEYAAAFFLELASHAGKDIDIFNRSEEMIAYHGQMPVLVEAMRVAWPEVKSSKNVVPWGIDEFCNRAMSYELLHFADSYPESAVPNPALLERIGFYSEIDIHQLSNYLAHLTGRGAKQWTLSDFALSSPKSRVEGDLDDEEPSEEQAIHTSGELNLYHLTVEFLGYLRRIEGVSYSKGELGRRELHQFLAERHKKKLEHRESMFESMMREEERRRGRRSPPKQKYSGYENILVPDRERLDQYIAGLLGMLNQLYYRASALFEIIPAWLGFLEAKRLIDDEVRVRTINDLSPLARDLKQAFSRYADDPGPHQALDGWPFCKSGFEL